MTNAKQYQARVTSTRDIGRDIRILRVELDDPASFAFQAGQYVSLSAENIQPRYFSVASAPHEGAIEFHIRDAGHGISAHLVEHLQVGAILNLQGAYGENIWQGGVRPVVALAGGIGIAPLYAMLKARVHDAPQDVVPFHLYWGVRDESQLYLHDVFCDMAAACPFFSYVPVVGAMTGQACLLPATARTGYIGAALVADFPTLAGFDIYMAGPKPMIDAIMPVLDTLKADKNHIFCDAFSA